MISIIALLVALLLPALAAARSQAQISQCLANTRQLAIAIFASATDNRDYFPAYLDPVTGNPDTFAGSIGGKTGIVFTGLTYRQQEQRPLNHYMNHNYEIFHCPSDVGGDKQQPGQVWYGYSSIFDYSGSSYIYNTDGISVGTVPHGLIFPYVARISETVKPTKCIAMGDVDMWAARGSLGINDPLGWHDRIVKPGPTVNVALVDGHSEFIQITDDPHPANFNGGFHFDPPNALP